jgi:hypothetical protein
MFHRSRVQQGWLRGTTSLNLDVILQLSTTGGTDGDKDAEQGESIGPRGESLNAEGFPFKPAENLKVS